MILFIDGKILKAATARTPKEKKILSKFVPFINNINVMLIKITIIKNSSQSFGKDFTNSLLKSEIITLANGVKEVYFLFDGINIKYNFKSNSTTTQNFEGKFIIASKFLIVCANVIPLYKSLMPSIRIWLRNIISFLCRFYLKVWRQTQHLIKLISFTRTGKGLPLWSRIYCHISTNSPISSTKND